MAFEGARIKSRRIAKYNSGDLKDGGVFARDYKQISHLESQKSSGSATPYADAATGAKESQRFTAT